MENNKKKTFAIVFTVFALVLVIGTTYAFISRTLTGTKKVTLTAGTLSLVLDEKNEITISDALPMYDQVGMIQEEVFEFDLINNTSNPTDYTLKLQKVSTANELSLSDVKYYLTKEGVGTPALLSTLTDGVVDIGTIEGNDRVEYTLRLWISDEVTEKTAIEGKSLSYKLAVEANQKIEWAADFGEDTSGANVPQLTSGMIPVVYDESDKVWVKADSANQEKYYNYDKQIWANAVTVTEATRDAYMAMDVGEPISMDDINTMWVWIPRYEYQYTDLGTSYAGGTQTQPGEIKIKFISSDTINPSDSNIYKIPEGFIFGTENVSGFWMGKFETSTLESCTASANSIDTACDLTTLTPQIKPNVRSWGGARVSTFFEASRLMQSLDDTLNYNADTYGFDVEGTSSMDTHMSKNTEWGIVAMLSQSKYGKYGNSDYTGAHKEVYINNSSRSFTGRSGGSYSGNTPINGTYTDLSDEKLYTSYGFYSYNDYLLDYSTGARTAFKVKGKGTGGSTTGTIYGVYDMSGGADEYVMGNYKNYSGSSLYNSGFCGTNGPADGTCRQWPNAKYVDVYASDTASSAYKFGDATYETSSWYGDSAMFVKSNGPWSRRGGTSNHLRSLAGVFYSTSVHGQALPNHASRFVIKP